MGSPDAEREVRIAIVMYGGTSLAIYMNGITQEFLQLVRATSRHSEPTEALSSTARVYRKMAHLLDGNRLDQIDDEALGTPPRVRFVIDILSGTSAGGINAVMLAKALVRNADLAPLKELWLEQGSLERLINDRASGTPRTPYREPVHALFNSDRMYVELLKAFEELNPSDPAREPLVESLDLVVTGTNLSGEPIDIRLADGVAQEYAHKHAFRFRYAADMFDEFKPEHDPLLAFAARSTSSLPAVFEPAVAEAARTLAGKHHRKSTDWSLLFRSLRRDEAAEHAQRAFADGGYLDNKPFGHAIDLLAQSTGSGPVTRKLYYLEPQPQRIDPDAPRRGVPNALENTLQVFSLARYETIRNDIQRLSERNRLIDRIRTLDAGVIEDLRVRKGATQPLVEQERPAEPHDRDLEELVLKYGPAYGGYHRLRVATATDALANTIADHAQLPAESDIRRALRFVVRAWRVAHYRRDRSGHFEPESAFLRRFDLQFHRRRARFLLAKVNELFIFDDQTVGELQNLGPESSQIAGLVAEFRHHERDEVDYAWEKPHKLLLYSKLMAQRAVHALTAVLEEPNGADGKTSEANQAANFRVGLLAGSEVRATLQGLFLEEGGEFRQHVRDELLAILGQPSEDASEQAAESFYQTRNEAVLKLARELERDISSRISEAEDALSDLDRLVLTDELSAEVRELLRTYWGEYEQFDMVQFPLIEATRVGEELSPVEIHRISPVDVKHYGRAFSDDKLKGTKFASFGAFLDRRWREHDIMWGRLDGAERLITSLLGDADPDARDQLIVETHLAILQDEFPADREEVRKLAVHDGRGANDAHFDVAATRANTVRFLQARARDLDLDPRTGAKDLSRLVRTAGKLSDTLSTEANLPNIVRNTLGFTSLLGSTLVDAAIPRTFWHLLASYWSSLILLLGAALVVLGLPLGGRPPLQGTLLWGSALVLAALSSMVLRSLVWKALSPAEPRTRAVGARALRWFGRISLLLAIALVFVGIGLERSSPGDELACAATGMPTAFALGLAMTSADLACALRLSAAAGATPAEAMQALASSPNLPRARALTYLAFGWALLLAALLSAAGLAAWASPARWTGVLGALLAISTGAAGVWATVRVLGVLERITTGVGVGNAWLAFTSGVTKVALLLALTTVAAMVQVLTARARFFPLSVRGLSWALALAASIAGMFGVLGLILDVAVLLRLGIALLAAVLIGLSFLFAVGFFASGAPRNKL